jgi:hypothetical protein
MTRRRPTLHLPPAALTPPPEPRSSSPAALSVAPVLQRFVGLDVHHPAVVVAAVDAAQQVMLQPRRVALERFAGWIETGNRDGNRLEGIGVRTSLREKRTLSLICCLIDAGICTRNV